MATTPAPAAKAAPALTPFRTGTQPTVKPSGYTQTNSLGSATIPLPDYQIVPTNILRGIAIEVVATGTNATSSVAYQGDGPLNVLSTVNFQDSGGNSIVGSFDSYTLAMIMKYGGYAGGNSGDPRNSVVYSAVTGTGATAGSFNFVLRIPVEAVSRTGLGSLQNQTTQSPLVLSMTLNTSAAVFSTAPTGGCSVKVSVNLLGYWKGSNAGASPSPKAYGTIQYWNRVSNQALNGASDFYLQQLGFGNPWRNVLFLNYATGGARTTTNFPSPLTINWKGNLFRNIDTNLWQEEMGRNYGLTGTTADTGPGLDTGVFVIPFNADFDQRPGAELGMGYLNTDVGDAWEMIGTWGASCTLYTLVNFFGVNGPASSIAGLY